MSEVTRLLTESRAAHLLYRQHAGRIAKDGKVAQVPDYHCCEQHLATALETRLAAHALDPEHLDPAWLLDTVPHDALVAYYTKYPSIP